jgi:hypothetical protein
MAAKLDPVAKIDLDLAAPDEGSSYGGFNPPATVHGVVFDI